MESHRADLLPVGGDVSAVHQNRKISQSVFRAEDFDFRAFTTCNHGCRDNEGNSQGDSGTCQQRGNPSGQRDGLARQGQELVALGFRDAARRQFHGGQTAQFIRPPPGAWRNFFGRTCSGRMGRVFEVDMQPAKLYGSFIEEDKKIPRRVSLSRGCRQVLFEVAPNFARRRTASEKTRGVWREGLPKASAEAGKEDGGSAGMANPTRYWSKSCKKR